MDSIIYVYNHHTVTLDPYFPATAPAVRGINLAFADDIASELEDKLSSAASTPKRIKHHKRLSHLRRHFFGLEELLCPAGDWESEAVPSPQLVSASLRQRYMAHGEGAVRTEDSEIMFRLLSEPSRLTPDRGAIRRVPDGPSIRVNQTIAHPTVTFISGRTDDNRTPVVSDDMQRW